MPWSRTTIPWLEEGDDIEQYLTTFEQLAHAYRWPKQEWAVFLVPYLSGRALDYDRVKEAILNKYEINEEVYRRWFQELDVRPGETPWELYNRLKDLFCKWVWLATKTVSEISEILVPGTVPLDSGTRHQGLGKGAWTSGQTASSRTQDLPGGGTAKTSR